MPKKKVYSFEKLIEAIQTKNELKAQELIDQMETNELSKIDNYGNTVLVYAIIKNLEKVCEMLIPRVSYNAINSSNQYGNTALSLATKYGFKNIYNLLRRAKCPKLVDKLHNKIIDNTEINAKDKTIMVDTIKDISQKIKLLISDIDREQIENSMRPLLNSKFTKLKFMIIEEQVDKLIEQQNTNFNQLGTKINIFQKLANEVTFMIVNDPTINAKDKAIMVDTIKDITNKAKVIYNTSEIEKMTSEIQKLLIDKPTKVKLLTLEEQIDELIEYQNVNYDISILGEHSTQLEAVHPL